MTARRVVVVGGGVAGLATAALLAESGAEVTLVERHDHLGGRAGLLEIDGFRFDTGPSWYFMPEVFEHFFGLLGERVEDHLEFATLDPSYRVFPEPAAGGSVEPFDIGPPDRVAAQVEALEPGAGERVERYVRAAGEAYRFAVDRFLYTTFRSPWRSLSPRVLRRSPLLVGLLGRSLADHVARTVSDDRLRQVLSYHAVFLGSSPYRVPALYSLMSHLDLAQPVRHPVGGMHAVVTALETMARDRGVTIRTGAPVARILVDGDRRHRRARGVVLEDGERIRADVVVSTADLHHTETALLGAGDATYPERYWRSKDPGISALLVYAGVRGELPQLSHHSLFFTRDWRANFDAILARRGAGPAGLRAPVPGSLYVSKVSATDLPGSATAVAPPGHEALVVLVPFPSDPHWGEDAGTRLALEELADGYLDQVGRWAGIDDLRSRVVARRVVGPADFARDFAAWRGGALGLEHTLRQSAMFRPQGASRRVRGLLYAGASVAPGIGVPMCLISAELVLKRLRGDTRATPMPVPLRPRAASPATSRGGGA